jgi:hypothetical protein
MTRVFLEIFLELLNQHEELEMVGLTLDKVLWKGDRKIELDMKDHFFTPLCGVGTCIHHVNGDCLTSTLLRNWF